VCIAREMLAEVRTRVRGAQIAAPMGRVPVALDVLDGALDLTEPETVAAPSSP
jgi:hypothetical protein